MKPLHKIDRRKKEVRELNKEYRKLLNARRELGYLDLPKPIRHGWFKHLALRDDVARRKDAPVFKEILAVCGIEIWGSDKKHADKVWTKKAIKEHAIQFPGIRKLHQKKYNKLSTKAKKWFDGFDWYWSSDEWNVKRYYCRVPRYYFKITYTKAFITKEQVVDPKIEKRLTEITQKLITNDYYNLDIRKSYKRKYFDPFYHRVSRRKIKIELTFYDEETFDQGVYKMVTW